MSRWARAALSMVVVLALAGAGTAAWLALRDGAPQGAVVMRDLDGRQVALDEAPDVDRGGLPVAGRFQAPAQGLDVPLVELPPSPGALNPPSLTEAFVVRADAEPAADGAPPRLVVMHAVRDGRAPGNAFVEPAADPRVMVRPGDPLLVGEDVFTVTGTEVLPKAETAAAPEIWGAHPDGDDRLVVVTCLQRAGQTGRAAENLVVHAVRAA